MKKLMSILLAVALVLAALPAGLAVGAPADPPDNGQEAVLVQIQDNETAVQGQSQDSLIELAAVPTADPEQTVVLPAELFFNSGENVTNFPEIALTLNSEGPSGKRINTNSVTNKENSYTSMLTVEIPEDGYYYAYGSGRTRSDSNSSRSFRLSVTQAGTEQFYPETFLKFKIEETENWKIDINSYPLFKNEEPLYLFKGLAQIKLYGGSYNGFSYGFLTKQQALMDGIDASANTAVPGTAKTYADYGCIPENKLYQDTLKTIVDPEAPETPTVEGAGTTGGAILVPDCAAEDLAGYQVFLNDEFLLAGKPDTDGELAVPLPGTSAASFRLRSVDRQGNRSALSEAVSVTPTQDSLPPVVDAVTVEDADFSGQVILSITASDDSHTVAGYRVKAFYKDGMELLDREFAAVRQSGEPLRVRFDQFPKGPAVVPIEVTAKDGNGQLSDPKTMDVIIPSAEGLSQADYRPQTYTNLGADLAAPASTAELPKDFTIMMLPYGNNLERETTGTWKVIDNLFLKTSDNNLAYDSEDDLRSAVEAKQGAGAAIFPTYVRNSSVFTKSYSGTFVIPESEFIADGGETYQIISSYLRVSSSGADDRRTQFYVIDGMAVSPQGLVPYNGAAGNWSDPTTNSYILGGYIPNQGSGGTSAVNQVYPFNKVGSGTFWDSTPPFQLEPGKHTIDVYTIGGTNFFNELFITKDIGYDMSKLMACGLGTRGNQWSRDYISNGVKAAFEDIETAPSFPADAAATPGAATLTTAEVSWTPAENSGRGKTGDQSSVYEVKYWTGAAEPETDGSNARYIDGKTTAKLTGLTPNAAYHVKITAYDYTGAGSQTSLTTTIQTGTSAPDQTPPTFGNKGNAWVTNLKPDRAVLNWTAATDETELASYQILDSAGRVLVDQIPVNRSSASVTGLTEGSDYTFVIRAADAAGNTTQGNDLRVSLTTLWQGGADTIVIRPDSQWDQTFAHTAAATYGLASPVAPIFNGYGSEGCLSVGVQTFTKRVYIPEDGLYYVTGRTGHHGQTQVILPEEGKKFPGDTTLGNMRTMVAWFNQDGVKIPVSGSSASATPVAYNNMVPANTESIVAPNGENYYVFSHNRNGGIIGEAYPTTHGYTVYDNALPVPLKKGFAEFNFTGGVYMRLDYFSISKQKPSVIIKADYVNQLAPYEDVTGPALQSVEKTSSDDTAYATFDLRAVDEGLGLAAYDVMVSSDGTNYELHETVEKEKSLPYRLNKLPSGSYQVKFIPVDFAGNKGAESEAVPVVLAQETNPPTWKPGEITVDRLTATEAAFSWPEAEDPDSGLAGYEYIVTKVGEGEFASGTTTAPSLEVTGLLRGTTYKIQVIALDAQKNPSAPLELQIKTEANSIPVWAPDAQYYGAAESNAITLYWDPATDADGDELKYRVYDVANKTYLAQELTGNSFTITDPEPGSYTLKLEATDGADAAEKTITLSTRPAEDTAHFDYLMDLNFDFGFQYAAEENTLTVSEAAHGGTDYTITYNDKRDLIPERGLGQNHTTALGFGTGKTYFDLPDVQNTGATVWAFDLYVKPGSAYTFTGDTNNRFVAYRLHEFTGEDADWSKLTFDWRLDYAAYESKGSVRLATANIAPGAVVEVTPGSWVKTRAILFHEETNTNHQKKVVTQYQLEGSDNWVTLAEGYIHDETNVGVGQIDFRTGANISVPEGNSLGVIDNLQVYAVNQAPALVWDADLTAGDVTDEAVTLSWSAPAENVNGLQKNYDVYYWTADEQGAVLAGSTDQLTYRVTGLAPATDYHFKVAAKNVFGGKAEKTAQASTLEAEDTAAPTWAQADAVTVTPAYEGAVLTWPAAEDIDVAEGRKDAVTYTVKKGAEVVDKTKDTIYCLTGLAPGTAYDYTVSCSSKVFGDGAIHELPVPFTTKTRPAGITTYLDANFDNAPQGMIAENASNPEFDARAFGGNCWTMNLGRGYNASVVGGRSGQPGDNALQLRQSPESEGLGTGIDWTLPINVPQDTILVTEFSLKLDTINRELNAEKTNGTLFGIRPIGTGGNLTDMRLSVDTNGVLSATTYGGSGFTGENLDASASAQYGPGKYYEWIDMRFIYDTKNNKANFMYKADDNQWKGSEGSYSTGVKTPITKFSMFARFFQNGQTTLDNLKIYTVEDTTPLAIDDLQIVTTTDSAALSPQISGGAGAAYYTYSYKEQTASDYQVVKTSDVPFVISGLEEGKTYDYKVSAFGFNYTKSEEKTGSFTIGDQVPPVWSDGDLTVTNLTQTGATVTWPAATDETELAGYNVYLNGGQEPVNKQTLVTQTTYALTGLTANTGYTVSVEAVDAAGNKSADRKEKAFQTLAEEDHTPPEWAQGAAITESSVSSRGFTIAWPAATDNAGAVKYDVYVDGAKRTETVSGLVYSVTGLTPDTTYQVMVKAVDASGNETTEENSLKKTVTTLPEGMEEQNKSLAVLYVDSKIEKEDGHMVLTTVDGKDMNFTVGLNAFKTLDDAIDVLNGIDKVLGVTMVLKSDGSQSYEVTKPITRGNIIIKNGSPNPTITGTLIIQAPDGTVTITNINVEGGITVETPGAVLTNLAVTGSAEIKVDAANVEINNSEFSDTSKITLTAKAADTKILSNTVKDTAQIDNSAAPADAKPVIMGNVLLSAAPVADETNSVYEIAAVNVTAPLPENGKDLEVAFGQPEEGTYQIGQTARKALRVPVTVKAVGDEVSLAGIQLSIAYGKITGNLQCIGVAAGEEFGSVVQDTTYLQDGMVIYGVYAPGGGNGTQGVAVDQAGKELMYLYFTGSGQAMVGLAGIRDKAEGSAINDPKTIQYSADASKVNIERALPKGMINVDIEFAQRVNLMEKQKNKMSVTLMDVTNDRSETMAIGSDMSKIQQVFDGAGIVTFDFDENAANYDGGFSVSMELDPGEYKLKFEAAGYSTYETEALTLEDQGTQVLKVYNNVQNGVRTFTAGDIDDNKLVELFDLSGVSGNYNAAKSYDSPELVMFDFDRNGVIDIMDVVYVIRNYNR